MTYERGQRPGTTRLLAPLAVFCVLVLAACASDKVPPDEWASKICVAVKPWSTSINAAVSAAQQKITSGSSPTQTKADLLTLYGGARDASNRALGQVQAAGIPDADNGAQVAQQFTAALTTARNAFAHAATRTAALSTSNKNAFYAGVVAVGQQLTTENGQNSAGFSNVSSDQLQKAFDSVTECK
ncbi:hypothetical protein [Fodinicola feengrottensis]|uniref:hypothetical protein n=1 Tax=Fodinicola feengrottensis TaxID=435914 RepID=UPI0013D3D35B|nr:hypothetical protein [Fodinicola feengrottensis]